MAAEAQKSVYERTFLELLLRHKLPDDATVSIHVSEPKESRGELGAVSFALGKGGMSVSGGFSNSGLLRSVNPVPTCW